MGIIVSHATKRTIERLARESGRSQAQVCEELLGKGLVYDSLLSGMAQKLDEIVVAIQAREQESAA